MAADADATWEFRRHGAGHDIYAVNGTIITVPRHREIVERTAQKIIGEAADAIEGK